MSPRALAITSIYSTLALCACSTSSEQPHGGGGGSTSAQAGALPGGAAGASGAGQGGTGEGGRASVSGAGGSSPVGGSGQPPVGGTATGGTPGSAGSGGAAVGGVSGAVTGGNGAASGGGAPGGDGGTAGTAGTAGTVSNDPFVLAWQDDFDTLDSSAWQLQTFTWEGNQATFSTQNASVASGVLTISLTAAPSGAEKPYLGVEMRSAKTLTYGKVSARMRFAKGSGVVSGLVLFYTPYPNCDWNEIDIEHLGKSSNSSQLNTMVFTGTPDPNCTASVTPTPDPEVVDLGFDAESDFHLYDIEWTPAGVKYFADGVLLRTWTQNIPLLRLPETILLTIWASSSADWAGAITPTSAPTNADVDWIKVYDYRGN